MINKRIGNRSWRGRWLRFCYSGQWGVNPSVAYGDSSPYRGAKARIPEVSPNRGDFFVPPERGMPGGQGVIRRIKRCRNPSGKIGDFAASRVVEKSVNFVSTFGAKSSVHSLLPEGNPLGGRLLSPPNPIAQPSAALLRYGCGIPLADTSLGFGGAPVSGARRKE